MFPLADDNDDGFSLLSCMKPDGTIDLQWALDLLSDVEDEHHIDESSLFSCLNEEGGLDVAKFLQMSDESSLLELTMLKEAGLTDNSN